MADFTYQEMFPLEDDNTNYYCLTKDHITSENFKGAEILKIDPQGLTLLAERAFRDAAHLLRPSHLKLVAKILDDPESSDNDRYVARDKGNDFFETL